MATDQFLSGIFPAKGTDPSASSRSEVRFDNLAQHLQTILSHFDIKDKTVLTPEAKAVDDGRIGNDTVTVDFTSQCGTMKINKDRIELESQSNFSSVRANVCVCKGKWMYEVLLGSKGIMQLGWATVKCRFTNEEGVGDTPDSYAYDGHRVRKWNVSTGQYGEEWMAGDIIGCLIDMDQGTISYTRNGRSLGVAFENIHRGAEYAYFPAISLSYAEVVQMNYGATPFRFPVDSYKPLQDLPEAEYAKTKELLEAFDRLLPPPSRSLNVPSTFHNKEEKISLLTVSHIFDQLAPLLTSAYIVESLLLPAFLNSVNMDLPYNCQPGVEQLLSYMWVCMEEFEIQPCLENLIWSLVKGYWYGPVQPDYVKQLRHLIVALNLVRHQPTCKLWLTGNLFHKFPYMLHVRPPDKDGIKIAFPVVWWQGIEGPQDEVDAKEKAFNKHCVEIKTRVALLEEIQVTMCRILMQLDEPSCSNRDPRSKRHLLAEKIRNILQDHYTASNMLQPVQACSGAVMTCFLHCLIGAFRYHWEEYEKEMSLAVAVDDAFVPHVMFSNGCMNYFDIARIGGIISHLQKAHRDDLKAAGITPPGTRNSLTAALSSIVGSASAASAAAKSQCDVNLDESLVVLLDSILLMYHTSVHRQLSKVHGVTEAMREHSKALKDTWKKIKKCPADRSDVATELLRAKYVFTKEATEVARHMGWVKSVIFSKNKQEDLHWILKCTLTTVRRAQSAGKLFVFMPEFYIENGIYLFQALWNYFMPLTMPNCVDGYEKTLDHMALFLANSLCDDRIINPDVCDTIIQGVATFVCFPETLAAMETIPEDKKVKLIRCLMSAYDKRTWVHTTWILVRFWRGDGFGFRHATSPDLIPFGISDQGGTIRAFTQKPCPSKVFQSLIGRLCLTDQKLSNDFLNGVLNQLNWAFSEFVGILQEIQHATSKFDASLPDTRQLRTCGICFDLTVGLLRVLEMISSVVPEVFTDFSRSAAELTLTRLFQAVIQILNRVAASCKLFETLSKLHATDIERQDRYAVLAAVAGILVTLLQRGTPESQSHATKILLSESGFQIESVAFLAGNAKPPGTSSTSMMPLFTFRKFQEVNEKEVTEVEQLLEYLKKEHQIASLTKQESLDSDNVCTICYAMVMNVKFIPCGHSSCKSCINRHLMNSKHCFFCKEPVTSLKEL